CALPTPHPHTTPTCFHLFFLTPRRPPTSTLFPYTTLFRSHSGRFRRASSAAGGAAEPLSEQPGAVDGIQAGELRFLKVFRYNPRSEEHTSELQSRFDLVCRLLLEKKKKEDIKHDTETL